MTIKINDAAIKRNKDWISGVTNALNNAGNDELCRCAMKSAGNKCAEQFLAETIEYFGKTPESINEMVEAINKRKKEVLKISDFWKLMGDKIFINLEKCSCHLVNSGLAEPNPTFCLCSAGMFESIFTPFHKGVVRTEIIKAIGRGDSSCEFIVHLE
jgi:predicted hydrocarbon binding protein